MGVGRIGNGTGVLELGHHKLGLKIVGVFGRGRLDAAHKVRAARPWHARFRRPADGVAAHGRVPYLHAVIFSTKRKSELRNWPLTVRARLLVVLFCHTHQPDRSRWRGPCPWAPFRRPLVPLDGCAGRSACADRRWHPSGRALGPAEPADLGLSRVSQTAMTKRAHLTDLS